MSAHKSLLAVLGLVFIASLSAHASASAAQTIFINFPGLVTTTPTGAAAQAGPIPLLTFVASLEPPSSNGAPGLPKPPVPIYILSRAVDSYSSQLHAFCNPRRNFPQVTVTFYSTSLRGGRVLTQTVLLTGCRVIADSVSLDRNHQPILEHTTLTYTKRTTLSGPPQTTNGTGTGTGVGTGTGGTGKVNTATQ
jgi:hypothetical protein